MMFQVFKSAVGHSIFGGSVIIHWQAQWIWTLKKLQCLTVKPFVSVFCCLSFLSIMNVESLEKGSHWLYIYVCKCKDRSCVQVQGTWCCVAPTMCASSRNVTIPTPAHPNPSHDLRSTDHVCKCKERYHPHPTPPQSHDLRSTEVQGTLPSPPHPTPTPPQLHIYKPPWGRSSRWTSCP